MQHPKPNSPAKTNVTGIFIEFDRWLKALQVTPRQVIYVGKPKQNYLRHLADFGIPTVKPLNLPASTHLSILNHLDLSNFNILIIDSPGNEFELITGGLPIFEVTVIRVYNKNQKLKQAADTITQLMDVIGYKLKYTAETKDGKLTDLFFIPKHEINRLN